MVTPSVCSMATSTPSSDVPLINPTARNDITVRLKVESGAGPVTPAAPFLTPSCPAPGSGFAGPGINLVAGIHAFAFLRRTRMAGTTLAIVLNDCSTGHDDCEL